LSDETTETTEKTSYIANFLRLLVVAAAIAASIHFKFAFFVLIGNIGAAFILLDWVFSKYHVLQTHRIRCLAEKYAVHQGDECFSEALEKVVEIRREKEEEQAEKLRIKAAEKAAGGRKAYKKAQKAAKKKDK